MNLIPEGPSPFMMCHTICDKKTRPKMQVDTFILLFLCCLFGVNVMRFYYMVIVN